MDRGTEARGEPFQCFLETFTGIIDIAQTPFRQGQSVSGLDIVWRCRQNRLQAANCITQDVLTLAGRHKFRQFQLRTSVLRIQFRGIAERLYPIRRIARCKERKTKLILRLGILGHHS